MPINWTPLHSCVSIIKDIEEILDSDDFEEFFFENQATMLDLIREVKDLDEVKEIWNQFLEQDKEHEDE